MTLDQFLDKLKPMKWQLLPQDGAIRLKEPEDGLLICPIAALMPPGDRLWPISRSEQVLGLRASVKDRIVHAADNDGAPATRRRLLKACGLKERT